MARGNRFFKAQFNQLLDEFASLEPGSELGSENDLAAQVGASRTTIRAILAKLAEKKIIDWQGREKRLIRRPKARDYFVESETIQPARQVESQFLQWIFQSDLPARTAFTEAELARRFDISVGAIREFLIKFEPFGLIEKQPNRHWILKGFTREFADEIFHVREMFEHSALDRLLIRGLDKADRQLWTTLRARHEQVCHGSDEATAAFPALDATFHEVLCAAANNRFITDFARTISIIVHYHYQWNKRDEVFRNRAAAAEHIDIIDAILAGDSEAARAALQRHLQTARGTLLNSVRWEQK